MERDDLAADWRALLTPSDANRHHELDPDHPLRLIFGSDEHSNPVFFAITTIKPPLPHLDGAVTIDRARRESDGRWTLSLILHDPGLFDVFVGLCSDLARRSRDAPGEAQALRAISVAIDEWRHLLVVADRSPLSAQAVQGLVAEMWFAARHLTHGHSLEQVVLSWGGPLGSSKDFVFPDGSAYEVKSVHADSRDVRISSAEQLDAADGELSLFTVLLEPSKGDAAAVTVPLLYEELRDGGRLDGELRRRMANLGVDISDPYYAINRYVATQLRGYEISDDFPAIRRADISLGVVSVSYTISTAAMGPFQILDTDLRNRPHLQPAEEDHR